MKISREGFRWMIFYDYKRGRTQQQCLETLRKTFGDKAPSQRTVYNWFTEFQRGRTSVCDDAREGRPKTAVVQENIEAVRKMIEENKNTTYKEIAAALNIGKSQIKTILHDHLSVQKPGDHWIPCDVSSIKRKIEPETKDTETKKSRSSINEVQNTDSSDEN